jgi:Fis family transcriptional regulator, factor for inversion stimulation protein
VKLTGMRDKTATRTKAAGARNGLKTKDGGAIAHANGRAPAAPATVNRALAGRNGSAGTPNAAMPRSTGESLEQSVFRSLEQYFANLDGAKPHALHEMVLGAIEKPLLKFALHRCEGNQSAAADLLGINRNTLRRKLQDYGLH